MKILRAQLRRNGIKSKQTVFDSWIYPVGEGDTLSVTETQDDARMTMTNPEFAKSMAVFESLSRRHRNTLRELAK